MVREASEAGVTIGSSGAVVGRERSGRGKQKGGGGRGVKNVIIYTSLLILNF